MFEHYRLAVIGTGPGGYIAALKAAQMGAKTAVVEKHHIGGTCLNYGCIPSKALLASAELLHRMRYSELLGVETAGQVHFDWPKIQKRKDKLLMKLRAGIKSLFAARNVTLYTGRAVLDGPGKIKVTDDKGGSVDSFTADKIILAAGSVPARIGNWPTDAGLVCTSDEALHWKELPGRLLIVGGGAIGCEFACMMNEYGVKVTVVEMMDTLLPGMDTSLGLALSGVFARRGITVHAGAKVEDIKPAADAIEAVISGGHKLNVDKVLVAVGRRADTGELGAAGIKLETDGGFIRVNDKMETAVENYYCVGDANGRCLLAHAAGAQGRTAVRNALGYDEKFSLPVPNVVYTFPEIASVGITTRQAQERKIPVSVGRFPIGHLGKAMAAGEEFGFVEVIRHREDETLLGVHIIGHNATEIIACATAMLSLKAGAKDLAEMIFAHPTLSESVREAAEDTFDMALHLPPKDLHIA